MALFNRLYEKKYKVDNGKLPVHIAIIPDGNGRWAQKRGLPRSAGHRVGSNTLKQVVKKCASLGIKYVTVYTFSTENWKRPKSEVDSLMELLLEYLKNAEKELGGSNIRIKVIGNIKGLSTELQNAIPKVEKLTGGNTGLQLNLALNYGGRDEIIQAIRIIAGDVGKGKIKADDINEGTVTDRLYTSGIPDPDLIIRTSGEKRSSNFLVWQSAYSELCFPDVLWPDFKEKHLMSAINDYQNRNRRFGGI
jgi:undecaprenyl diphosphate synthase